MKYRLTWKDPDYYDGDGDTSDEEQEKLRKLGVDEYVSIEFDTEKMTANVIRPRE